MREVANGVLGGAVVVLEVCMTIYQVFENCKKYKTKVYALVSLYTNKNSRNESV